MVSAEREIDFPRTRSFVELTTFPGQEKTNLVLATDVEGPLFLGDFINEAMSTRVRPQSALDALPTHGEIIYAKTWQWFTDNTLHLRGISDYCNSSISQEGEDTFFTMPLFLAHGVAESDLVEMTLASRPTKGADKLVSFLEESGALIVGVTTAPQEPYRELVQKTGILSPQKIIGSPFPLDSFRNSLVEAGVYESEVEETRKYLDECFDIIDSHSTIEEGANGYSRNLTEQGESRMQANIARFHIDHMGLEYQAGRRLTFREKTMMARAIESIRIVGDRGKAAVASQLEKRYRAEHGILVTEGDGVNDSLMLKKAEISIGFNGADAARAAKIGVVTDDRANEIPIYEAIIEGERDIDRIVSRAQAAVGSGAIIHRGGPTTDQGIIEEHKKMKKALRGNIIY